MADLNTQVEADRIYMRGQLQRVAPPTGFGWDFNAYPINIYKDGPRHFSTDIDLRSLVTSNIWNGAVYYVDVVGGNDANNGTSVTTPVKTLFKARQLLEASAAAGGVILSKSNVESGLVFAGRTLDFNDTANTSGGGVAVQPTKPFALISYGGRTIMGSFFTLSWSYDAASLTYSVSRSNVAGIVDVSSYDRWGVYKRLRKIAAGADLAATRTLVAASPGSYAQLPDNTVVVRLENDVPVSDATTKVIAVGVDAFRTGAVDCYASGFSFWGAGASVGAVDATTSQGTRNIVLEDCDASFSGIDGGTARSAYRFDRTTGIVALRGCTGTGSLADIYSFNETSSQLHALMIDCSGLDAGRAGSSPAQQSNQIVTCHNTAKLISLNTRGVLSAGGVVRNIDSSEHWDLGSDYGSDRGDRHFGGLVDSCGVQINSTAKYWGDCITTRGVMNSFYKDANATLLVRDPIEMGGRRVGTIGTY